LEEVQAESSYQGAHVSYKPTERISLQRSEGSFESHKRHASRDLPSGKGKKGMSPSQMSTLADVSQLEIILHP
jgi:hypothetical protein